MGHIHSLSQTDISQGVAACRPVRLNVTRFATEQTFDWMYILELDGSGFQSVIQKVSGNFSQVGSFTLPENQLVCSYQDTPLEQAPGLPYRHE